MDVSLTSRLTTRATALLVKCSSACIFLLGLVLLSYSAYVGKCFMGADAQIPWPVWSFLAVGFCTCISGILGMLGVIARRVVLLNGAIILTGLLLAAQTCIAVACFVDKSWVSLLPPEPSSLRQWLEPRLDAFKWIGLAVVGAQGINLGLACLLQSVYSTAQDAAQDERDDLRREPLLMNTRPQSSPAPVASSSSPRTDPWSQRMMERYGLDTSRFTYDPERNARPGASATRASDGSDDDAEHSKRCIIQ